MNWIRRKIAMWLAELLVDYLVIGAHCGCCGAWIKDSIVPYYWRVDICDTCKEDTPQTNPAYEVITRRI